MNTDNKQQKNKLCTIQKVGGSAIFTYADLKKATTIKWFEKIALWFIQKQYQVEEIEGHTLVYKTWRGKIYVLNHWINPPKHWNCRCSVLPK